MKKKVIIVTVVVAAVLALAGAAWYFGQRWALENMYGMDPKLCKAAKHIKGDDTWDECITVTTENYVVDIPKGYIEKHTELDAKIFQTQDKSRSIIMVYKATDWEDANLMNLEEGEYDEELGEVTEEKLEKVFNSLGDGLPDTYYSTIKGAAMLDAKDFNMFDKNNVIAFQTYYVLKKSINYTHIYERGDVRALVADMGSSSRKSIYIFHKDNLDKSYSIAIDTDNEDDIVKLLNSFVFIKK